MLRKKTIARKKKSRGILLFHDIIIISIGIALAIILSNYGLIDKFISSIREYYFLASFIAGIFFTSAFTIAPASIALVKIAEYAPTPVVVIWGALGAMIGDLILFFFIKDRFYDDIVKAIKPKVMRHIMHSFHFGFLKWLSPIIAALVIVSPLPDEFAMALFGMSKIKTAVLIPITFIMNIVAVYLLIQFAALVL